MCSKPNDNAADNVPSNEIAVKRNTVKKDMPFSEAIDDPASNKQVAAAVAAADVIYDGSGHRWMQLPGETKPDEAETVAKEWCVKMNALVYGHYDFVEVIKNEEGPMRAKVDFKVTKRQAAAAFTEIKKASEEDKDKKTWEEKVDEESLLQSQKDNKEVALAD